MSTRIGREPENSPIHLQSHRHDDGGGVVGAFDELDLGDLLVSTRANREVAKLLTPKLESKPRAGDIRPLDVVGEMDTVLQREVFEPASGVVEADDHRDGLRLKGAFAPQPLIPLRKWIAWPVSHRAE